MAKLKNINLRFTIIKIIKHGEDQIMKTLLKFAVVSLFILSACTSANQLSSVYDDDGVYSSKKEKTISAQTQTVFENQKITEQKNTDYKELTPKSYNTENAADKSQMSYDKYKQSQAENANNVVDNSNSTQTENVENQENQNYSNYDTDDYYDYGYSSRLRRFHNPCRFSSYYDDYYTNMYWYNYDPFYFGTSIYTGYNWWGPSYSFYNPYYYNNWGWNFGFGIGYGWSYFGIGYYGWNSPYYWGGYYGYGSYGNGYNDGYNDGYWASNNNSSTSSYFGPRNYIGASNGTTTPAGGSGLGNNGVKGKSIQPLSSTDNSSRKYDNTTTGNDLRKTPSGSDINKLPTDIIRDKDIAPNTTSGKSIDNKIPGSNQDERINTFPSTSERKTEQNSTKDEIQKNTSRSYNTPVNQNPSNNRINNYQRYSRSNQERQLEKPINQGSSSPTNTYNYREPKSYSSPSYSQPRSSQEFEAPKYKSERNYSAKPEQTRPSNYQETPKTNNNNNRNYNTPSNYNQNRNYTPPANNENRNHYTPPANNNENRNYSQPSNNNNYSTPAPSRSTYTPPPSSSGGNNSRSSGGGNSGSENQRRR